MAANLSIKITAEDAASKVFRQVETSAGGLGSKLGGMAATAGAVGLAALASGAVAVGAGLAASVTAAADFEKQMSSIKAVSGATAGEMATLQTLALDLGKSTSFSASEAAAGIEELIKAGVSIGDVMGGGAAAALDLAAAGGVRVADAAEIASNAMNQFGLTGADMAHVADTIAGAANASAIDMTDFKFSLAAVGAVANAAGLDFDNTAVAIAELGQAGIKGSDAGTSLKAFIAGLTPSSNTAKKALQDLGLVTEDGGNKFFDASGKLKSMAEIQQLLRSATGELTEEQRLMAFETIFGSDAIRAAAVLAKNGAEGYEEMAASMGKVTAQAVAAERLNNLAGDFEQLKGALETAAITLGLALLPGLRMLTQWATEGVSSVIPAIDAIGQSIGGVLGPAFDALLGVLPTVMSAMEGLFALFSGDASISQLVSVGQILTTAFGPEAATLIMTFTDLAGQAFSAVATFALEQFGMVVSWFQENWPLIQQTIAVVLAAIMALWEEHGANILTVVRSAWTILSTVVSTAIASVLDVLRIGMQLITGDWAGAWDTFTAMLGRTAAAWGTILSAAWDAIVAIVDIGTGGALTRIGAWIDDTSTAISNAMTGLERLVSDGWEAVKSAIAGILPAIGTVVMAFWDALPEDIRTDLVLIATHIATTAVTWVQNLTTAGTNMLTAITTSLGQMVEAVTTWATSTFLAPIIGLSTSAGTQATAVGEGMRSSITTKLGEIIEAVTTWADSTFLAPLRGLVGTAQAEAQRIGQAIVDGISGAISAGAGAIREAAYGAARSALDAAKGALGIESPSRVFNVEVGRMIPAGVIEGIRDMARPLDTALAGMVQPPSPGGFAAGGFGGLGAAGIGGAGVVVNLTVQGSLVHERELPALIGSNWYQGLRDGRIA